MPDWDEKDWDKKIDALQRRCPRLGGEVNFSYCRTCGESDGICFKALDCWWERFDVASYLSARLTRKEFEALESAKPPSKVSSLIDLIEKARRNTEQSDS